MGAGERKEIAPPVRAGPSPCFPTAPREFYKEATPAFP